jgi:hypothetical protein
MALVGTVLGASHMGPLNGGPKFPGSVVVIWKKYSLSAPQLV